MVDPSAALQELFFRKCQFVDRRAVTLKIVKGFSDIPLHRSRCRSCFRSLLHSALLSHQEILGDTKIESFKHLPPGLHGRQIKLQGMLCSCEPGWCTPNRRWLNSCLATRFRCRMTRHDHRSAVLSQILCSSYTLDPMVRRTHSR